MALSLPFIVIPLFFLIAIGTMFRRKRGRRSPAEIEIRWDEMNLFERHGLSPEGRIEAALYLGCEKLGVANAIVCLHEGEACRVQNIASLDGIGVRFVVGQTLSRSLIFCGQLGRNRNSLVIDYAGISDWRRHSAHTELGWESYLGLARELNSGETLTVAFYHCQPREALFSAAERRLAGQLADWVAAILERERGFSSGTRGLYPEAVVRA